MSDDAAVDLDGAKRRVDEYSGLGDHRTGTEVDRETVTWFADELAALGGSVERHPFDFQRYEAQSTVTIDGDVVPSDVLFYSGSGTVSTGRPHVAALAVMAGHGVAPDLTDEIAAAMAAGSPAMVVATEHPLGELVMPNRSPGPADGLPVVLVAGRHSDHLASGRVFLEFSARTVAGRSDNVVASFGPAARPVSSGHGAPATIVLATPLSGWFTCAAERGTGIAVLLGLVERLAADRPVIVVGSPGHELLPHLGVHRLLDGRTAPPVAASDLVVHLGANVAVAVPDADAGGLSLAPTGRGCLARSSEESAASVAACLRPIGVDPVLHPPAWLGEGAAWAEKTDARLLSFVGRSPVFHTRGDVPDAATAPAATIAVRDAIADAVVSVLDHPGGATHRGRSLGRRG